MSLQRILFSGGLCVLFVRALAVLGLFDEVELYPDTSLRQENLASDEISASAQDFFDDTENAIVYDDGFSAPPDPLFFTAFPSDVSTLATSDNVDPIRSSMYDNGFGDPDLYLVENSGCSPDNDDDGISQLINKSEKKDMCNPTDSTNPSTPDQSFERGDPTDPEFYGLSLVGYDLAWLGLEEQTNGCRRDALGVAQFLVCDSGKNEDRIMFYNKYGILSTGVALQNCDRSMYSSTLFLPFPLFFFFFFGFFFKKKKIKKK